jgi:hypothetical protein
MSAIYRNNDKYNTNCTICKATVSGSNMDDLEKMMELHMKKHNRGFEANAPFVCRNCGRIFGEGTGPKSTCVRLHKKVCKTSYFLEEDEYDRVGAEEYSEKVKRLML